MNTKQLQEAYLIWRYRYYKSIDVDQEVDPFLTKDISEFSLGQSWLKKTRNALFLSAGSVAQNLNVSRSAYAKLEKSEMRGTISINALARAANAMDCEFVYAIRPRKKVRFSWLVWQVLLKASIQHHWVTSRPQVKKADALAFIAKQKMTEAEFRRKQGWSERFDTRVD